MPNWAELHELALPEKASHKTVKYVAKSRKPGERCGNCLNFIPDHPNRCRTVQTPIDRPAWCLRYTSL